MKVAVDRFVVPPELEAAEPPEQRGSSRDGVRLLVAGPDGFRHRRFRDLPAELAPGDLLVVNVSATLPASVVVDADLALHFSTRQPDGLAVVEPRRPLGHASLPHDDPRPGRVGLPGSARVELLEPYRPAGDRRRLWLARFEADRPLTAYLAAWGRPIRYRHAAGPYGIEAYQTVFSRTPGSAEMPSAARPFTARLVARLASSGVGFAPLTLHTGVSSLEAGEPPYPERFAVPDATAALVNHTRERGGRIVAVGTTVVRALATATDAGGEVRPARGWTDRVIGAGDELPMIDGLVTGWHEPASSHLAMLAAVAGGARLAEAYERALAARYLWHEFGDSLLLLR